MRNTQQVFDVILDHQSDVLRDILIDLQDVTKVRASGGTLRALEVPPEQLDALCARYDAWQENTVTGLNEFFHRANMAEHMTKDPNAQLKAQSMGADLTTKDGFTAFYGTLAAARAKRKLVQHRTHADSLPSVHAASTRAIMKRIDPLFDLLRQAHGEWKTRTMGEDSKCDFLDEIVASHNAGRGRG